MEGKELLNRITFCWLALLIAVPALGAPDEEQLGKAASYPFQPIREGDPMNVENLTPMLRTWDLPGTIEFYGRVLGFEIKAHAPDLGWASMACGPATVMLSGPNEHEGDRAPAFTGSLYFRVSDVDGLWSRLQHQARVGYPIETFDYGMREFAIYDNNGYLLQFGEAIRKA